MITNSICTQRSYQMSKFKSLLPSPTPINILFSKYCLGSLDAAVKPAIFAAVPLETNPAAGILLLINRLETRTFQGYVIAI